MAQDLKHVGAALDALDDATRLKLVELPRIINEWLAPHGGLAGRRILDFGCGFGEMAAGIALGFDPLLVVGVDIGRGPAKGIEQLETWLGKETFPQNLRLEQVTPGDLGSLDPIDVVVSWSALEHVAREALEQILCDLHARLAPDGIMMLQISPLYFSPSGAHLWPCGYGPWEHLQKSSAEVMADIANCKALNERQRQAVTEMFLELNRLTAPEVADLLQRTGFRVLRQQLDRTDMIPPARLTDAYALDALTTDQVVLLVDKAPV